MFCLRKGGGYCSSCFPPLSLGPQHSCCQEHMWATLSALVDPFGSGSMASTKISPFADRKASSKTSIQDKWIATSIGLALIPCLIPIMQDFQYTRDWNNTNVFCVTTTLLRVYSVWVQLLSFSQASLSAKAGYSWASSKCLTSSLGSFYNQ